MGYSPPPNDRSSKHKKVSRRNSPERRAVKESSEEPAINDPVLEARRRKFESMKLIDPVKANKKIKLIKSAEQSEKEEDFEEIEQVDARASEELDEDLTLNEGEDIELEPYDYEDTDENVEEQTLVVVEPVKEKKSAKDKLKKKKKKDKELYQVGKLKGDASSKEKKRKKKHKEVTEEGPSEDAESGVAFEEVSEEGDLRAELSRRRAERLNRVVPVQSARLVQSAFKGVVSE